MDESKIITKTKIWIKEFIIDNNICPFAKPSFESESIAFQVTDQTAFEDVVPVITQLLLDLNSIKKEALSNAFLILSTTIEFTDFLDLVHSINLLLEETELAHVFQLVSFHPNYQFDGYEENDKANLRNQSPYPMFHILRQQEVENAALNFGDTSLITKRNIELLRSS